MFERSTQNKHFKSTRCSTMFTIYTEKQLPRSTIGKITNILFILHVSLSRYVPFECTYFYEGGLRREIRVPRRLRLFVFFLFIYFFVPGYPPLSSHVDESWLNRARTSQIPNIGHDLSQFQRMHMVVSRFLHVQAEKIQFRMDEDFRFEF